MSIKRALRALAPVRSLHKKPVLGLATLLAASTLGTNLAHAEWLKAESRHFIVYSNGYERELRKAVTELENFDATLRIFMNVNPNAETYRKLPIYILSGSDMRVMLGSNSNRIAGFYTATDEDTFAIANRDENFSTLKHEYAHHFMKSQFNFPFPAWYVEGFAEFYSSAEFSRTLISVGKPDQNRAPALNYVSWMPISQLISSRPFEIKQRSESYYPLAWLLTHWFMARPEARPQMLSYLKQVGEGVDSVEAMQNATGMTPAEITSALRRYVAGRIRYAAIPNNLPVPEMTITVMPASADGLLILGQKLKTGISEEENDRILATIRSRAASYPDDTLALLVLGHAEYHNAEDDVAAEAILTRLLDIDPDHVEALQYIARIHMDRADNSEDSATNTAQRRLAQSYLARAYAADDANYITFMLMAQNRSAFPGYPNENDLETLHLAYLLAPQLAQVALNYASGLIAHDRHSEAVPIIQIVANNPHMPENESINELLRIARQISDEEWQSEKDKIEQQAAEELSQTGEEATDSAPQT